MSFTDNSIGLEPSEASLAIQMQAQASDALAHVEADTTVTHEFAVEDDGAPVAGDPDELFFRLVKGRVQ